VGLKLADGASSSIPEIGEGGREDDSAVVPGERRGGSSTGVTRASLVAAGLPWGHLRWPPKETAKRASYVAARGARGPASSCSINSSGQSQKEEEHE
jgi:hypothetical protein